MKISSQENIARAHARKMTKNKKEKTEFVKVPFITKFNYSCYSSQHENSRPIDTKCAKAPRIRDA